MFKRKQFFPLIIVGLSFVIGCGTEEQLDDRATEVKEIPAPTCPDPASEMRIQSGVIVSPDDATVETFYAPTTSSSTTPLEALLETGLDVVTADFGAFGIAICAIEGVGQPANNCFGDPDFKFWSLFIRKLGGEWEAAEVGADAYEVLDGDLIAFFWTGSDPTTFDPLRMPDNSITFCDVATP